MSFLIGALGVVFAFGLVIFIHEFGHFIVAKKSNIKVERFSFGLGPELFGFLWGETRYCLAWIPLGGEVRMAGEMEYEEGDDKAAPQPRDPRDFFAQPWYRRLAVVLAGSVMNYFLAFVLFSCVAFTWGDPHPSTEPVIGDLMDGYPAQAAGLEPGDRVLFVAGDPVSSWNDLADRIHGFPEKTVTLDFQRGTEKKSIEITPRRAASSNVGLIGIAPSTVYEKVGFVTSLSRGATQTIGWSLFTLEYLAEKIIKKEKPELSGPLGIATVISKAAKSGAKDFFYLIALISVGIGLFNLFPIPLLDGGHMMFFLWEGVSRRPVNRKVMSWANTAGISLLVGILLYATYSDIRRMRPSPAEKNADVVEIPAPADGRTSASAPETLSKPGPISPRRAKKK